MQLAIIILNWNAAEDTIRCVQSIAQWKDLQPTIWVVDNGSVDGNAERIAQSCPHIHLIRNGANLGYAGGNNQAVRAALAQGNVPLLFLNNDAEITEADVSQLVETLQANPHFGFVGPLLVDAEKPDKLLAAGGQNIIFHLTSHRLKSSLPNQPIELVDYIPGTVMLARAEVFRQVGLLDEAYFFTGEMPDICYRAQQHGYLSAVDRRARARHALKRSSGLRQSLYVYYILRNRFLFLRKHYRWQVWLYAFWICYSLALAIKLRLSGQPSTARAVWLGLWDGLRGQFGGQNERILAANTRRVAGINRL
jgi:hypothetical protein